MRPDAGLLPLSFAAGGDPSSAAFLAIIAYCGVMLMFWRYWQRSASGGVALAAQWLLLAMIAGNAVTTTLQCGFYSCPDNPTRYLWLAR